MGDAWSYAFKTGPVPNLPPPSPPTHRPCTPMAENTKKTGNKKTHHPRNRTLSPTCFLGRSESRHSCDGRGPYDMLPVGGQRRCILKKKKTCTGSLEDGTSRPAQPISSTLGRRFPEWKNQQAMEGCSRMPEGGGGEIA